MLLSDIWLLAVLCSFGNTNNHEFTKLVEMNSCKNFQVLSKNFMREDSDQNFLRNAEEFRSLTSCRNLLMSRSIRTEPSDYSFSLSFCLSIFISLSISHFHVSRVSSAGPVLTLAVQLWSHLCVILWLTPNYTITTSKQKLKPHKFRGCVSIIYFPYMTSPRETIRQVLTLCIFVVYSNLIFEISVRWVLMHAITDFSNYATWVAWYSRSWCHWIFKFRV